MKSLKLLLRFATIGGLILLLLIPLLLIRGTVQDRARYRDEAVERVAQSKAGEQQFIAPVRVLPFTEDVQVTEPDEQGNPRKVWRKREGQLLQTPRTLTLSGELTPSERKIGLFRVQVYSWKAGLKAEFDPFAYPAVAGRSYGRPHLAVGISDVRGLVGTPSLRVDGRSLPLESGAGGLAERSAGIHADLQPLSDALAGTLGDGNLVEMSFVLDGTRSLAIAPIADNNDIALRSAWPHPLFGGRFLPNAPTIGQRGFDASWSLSSLATGAQTQLQSSQSALDTLEVRLVDPVDVYTQADRASKYGILFVVLTFVAFVLFELIKRLPIHPLQYLLVGLALAIFFLLLLSLSEHIAFWQAYLVSAAACIGLQFFYLSGVLRSWVRAAGFSAMLTALYGVLYSLLISEDNALLMGSLLLFGILASIMWVTRKLDWYELGNSLR
ncbi:inner membrane protein [Xanthomonas campestris]|uniref:cell envelope integrity protein CreD n=1 Tax=Xanthomonas TaxID=338 RepID=UPI00063EC236|nr:MULTISPECIES: cell envelope integrity protein CreD [Xanthomonas]MEB1608359.1 cell envelope integrity protein CreD [Xanthomonas campestris pv. campestris]MBB3849131.1 inner membrane protein [Xanthomonas arboricola]MBB5735248.1 inner membrane protein [Xanthomonas sp. CFBP 8152]NIJ75951.1 inner membrane protein [Xanthomonas sp. CFBP 8151]PPT21245.1 cell envelope integrity protein CreD [Xanthomonas arboricola]